MATSKKISADKTDASIPAANHADPLIDSVVEQLCRPESYEDVIHSTNNDTPMPSVEALTELMDLLRAVLFPGYHGTADLKPGTMRYYIGAYIDRARRILAEQIKRGYCFYCDKMTRTDCEDCERKSAAITADLISSIPRIRHLLSTDVSAAYEGDPAAKNTDEVIFCYPSIHALTNHRIAHELYKADVPLIPRIISEMAHSATGIDIHPGAEIGERFFMDHGTGIVIGETSIIGNNVRLYQGVTLGAKSFPLDAEGNPVKDIPRHPIVEDDVIIYSGATVLGRITIRKGAVIGGNVWCIKDVPEGCRLLQTPGT
jgi:serine O-acetyltransferase